jgi:hypothetical protein
VSQGERGSVGSHDRRSKPRIFIPFPIRVHGLNSAGEDFHLEAVLDNLSADGLYMRIMPRVDEGTKLSIEIALDPSSRLTEASVRILAVGTVLRSEEKPGGVCGIAVLFENIRFR